MTVNPAAQAAQAFKEGESGGNKRLRVAVLNRVFSPTGGGAERYSIALVEQLASRHDIHVFAQQIEHHWTGVTYHRMPTLLRKPRWLNQLWFATLTWWMTRRGFDVVHSHENTWHGNVQTVHVLPVKHNLFKGRNGLARAVRWLKVLTSPRLLAYLVLERCRFTLKPKRQIVVTSDSLQTVMAATYPGCVAALSVITPGFSPSAERSSRLPAVEQQTARVKFKLPVTSTCWLLVANDFRKKGLNTALDALAKLPSHHVLAVVGNPVQAPEFQPQISRLNLTTRVFFLGRLADVTEAYRAANYLVHPTLEDTFAMVVLEALAFRLPVVVSGPQFCGISGLLQHQLNAWLLNDPTDAQALADAIRILDADEPLRDAMSGNAAIFAKGYRWEGIAAQQEVVYRLASDSRRSPSDAEKR